MSELNVIEDFRLSFATLLVNTTGEKPVISLSAALSLSKNEVINLGKTDRDHKIADLPLACFWKRIGKNQFCLPDGGVVNSQTTLRGYYDAARSHYTEDLASLADKAVRPTYTICFKEIVHVPNSKKAGDVPLDLTLHTFENKAAEFGSLPGGAALDPNAVAQASAMAVNVRPGQMKPAEWNEVVVINGLLNGCCVDQGSQTITRARRTAFKLEPNPLHPMNFSPGTITSAGVAQLRERAKAEIEGSPILGLQKTLSAAFPGGMKLLSDESDDAKPKPGDHKDKNKDDEDDDKKTSPEPLDHLYPLWEVSDDSRIRIETVSTTLQLASAAQGFSSTSVEAAVATSVMAIAVDVAAGFGMSSKTGSSTQTGHKTEQMHATYEFPRVRLYLDEEAITLSTDCAAAIRHIEATKSYQAVLDFYRDYGHLFVTRVKLGGRLRATRYLSAEETKTMASTQNAWKASIATSLSGVPGTSASVKVKTESGDSSEQKSAQSDVREAICWEAHGGNTTLANNPGQWCNTVENFWYWRVVDQEEVLPIEDVISRMPGFENTRNIFAGIIIEAQFLQQSPLDIPWDKIDGAELGRGLSSSKGVDSILHDFALKAGDVKKIPLPPSFEWAVIGSNQDLHNYLVKTFGRTINPYLGTRLFHSQVWRLGLNDRAFSVILTVRSGLEKETTTFSMNVSQPTDQKEWRGKYGDYYIDSIVSGNATTLIWTFNPQTPSNELLETKKAIATWFSAPARSSHVGCAYMAQLSIGIPCESYLYDAYYNEIAHPPPTTALSALAQRELNSTKQALVVSLKSYRDVDSLQEVAGLTAPSHRVSSASLAALRRDHVEYIYQSTKRKVEYTPLDPHTDLGSVWSSQFSQANYYAGLTDPEGNHAAATGLAKDYRTLLCGSPGAAIESRMVDWTNNFGDEGALERSLRWLRKSRQAEYKQLSSQSRKSGNTIFGLKGEPDLPESIMNSGRERSEIKIFSLRDELKNIKDLEGPMAASGGQLDGMWNYFDDADLFNKMKFAKPARVVAYELSTTWNGEGTATPDFGGRTCPTSSRRRLQGLRQESEGNEDE